MTFRTASHRRPALGEVMDAPEKVSPRWVPGFWRAPFASTPRVRDAQINALLWTAQACLAMAFIASGFAKLTEPMRLLIILLDWPADVHPRLVRLLGLMEIAAAILCLLPLISWTVGARALRIGARLIVGLTLVFGAVHAVDRHLGFALFNIGLMGLALAILRFRRLPDWV